MKNKKKIKVNAEVFELAGISGIFAAFAIISEEMIGALDNDVFRNDEFDEMKECFRICKANFDEGIEKMASILRDKFDVIEGK